jgi:hypothetical protein
MASSPSAANISPLPVRTPLLISRNAIGEKIRDALHLYVGRGRRYSVKQLSDATGVPERSIEAAKCEPDDPEYRPLALENLLSIAKFLGSQFVSHYLELAGLGAFDLMDGQPPLPEVFVPTTPTKETPEQERKRLIRRLAELEELA